jgi:hypothetical protein
MGIVLQRNIKPGNGVWLAAGHIAQKVPLGGAIEQERELPEEVTILAAQRGSQMMGTES